MSKCWTAAVRTPYLGHLAAAVRGGVAGTKRVAGRARAAGLAVRPLAAVVRVVLAGCVSDLVPPSVVVVSAVRGDFSPCCNKVTRCQKHMTCTRTAPLKIEVMNTHLVQIRRARTSPCNGPSGLFCSCTAVSSPYSRLTPSITRNSESSFFSPVEIAWV